MKVLGKFFVTILEYLIHPARLVFGIVMFGCLSLYLVCKSEIGYSATYSISRNIVVHPLIPGEKTSGSAILSPCNGRVKFFSVEPGERIQRSVAIGEIQCNGESSTRAIYSHISGRVAYLLENEDTRFSANHVLARIEAFPEGRD